MQLASRRATAAAARVGARAVHSSAAASSLGSMHPPGDGRIRTVTVLPGHGCVSPAAARARGSRPPRRRARARAGRPRRAGQLRRQAGAHDHVVRGRRVSCGAAREGCLRGSWLLLRVACPGPRGSRRGRPWALPGARGARVAAAATTRGLAARGGGAFLLLVGRPRLREGGGSVVGWHSVTLLRHMHGTLPTAARCVAAGEARQAAPQRPSIDPTSLPAVSEGCSLPAAHAGHRLSARVLARAPRYACFPRVFRPTPPPPPPHSTLRAQHWPRARDERDEGHRCVQRARRL